ncbi:MAG: alpha/beta hydrolase [bacterium]
MKKATCSGNEFTFRHGNDRIRYRVVGERGPKLVLVHGFADSMETFNTVVNSLSQFATCYVVNTLGAEALIQAHDHDIGLRRNVEIISRLVVDNDIKNIFGHSLGGNIASGVASSVVLNADFIKNRKTNKIELARRKRGDLFPMDNLFVMNSPQSPKDILMGNDIFNNIIYQTGLKSIIARMFLKNLDWNTIVPIILKDIVQEIPPEYLDSIKKRYSDQKVRHAFLMYVASIIGDIHNGFLQASLHHEVCNRTLIYASNDKLISPDAGNKIFAQSKEKTTLRSIDGGHMCHIKYGEKIANIVIDTMRLNR